MEFSRRQLLLKMVGAAGAVTGARAVAAVCGPTPAQGEGPYYPERDLNRDADLTSFRGSVAHADWDVILLGGQVLDVACKPLAGALVEIWQAAPTGRYNHSGDRNTKLKLEPDFQYWGRSTTDATGTYSFKTAIPGYYPLDPRFQGRVPSGPGQFRPPHIHIKVHARGFLSLTTQMYFDPKSYTDANEAQVVSDLNRWENVDGDLMVRFSGPEGAKAGTFDIVLRK